MDHRVVNEAAGVERRALPPRERLDAHDLRGGLDLLHDGGAVAEHSRARVDGLPVVADGECHGWRPLRDDVGGGDLAVRLVLRRVELRVGRERGDHLRHVGVPMRADEGMQPVRVAGILVVVEPVREREVPEADDGLDAVLLELARHLDVAANGFLVIDAGLRLHARPLDAEAVVRRLDFLQRVDVLLEFRPAIKRVPARRGLALGDEHVPIRGEPILLAGFTAGSSYW